MNLSVFIQEIRNERDAILDFWTKNSLDLVNGGFIGKLDFSGKKTLLVHKGWRIKRQNTLDFFLRLVWQREIQFTRKLRIMLLNT